MPEFTVKCVECGKELAASFNQKTTYPRDFFLEVEPCPTCMETSLEKGKNIAGEEAYEAGMKDGKAEGREEREDELKMEIEVVQDRMLHG